MGDLFRDLRTTLASLPTQTYPEAQDLMGALGNLGQVEFGTYAGTGSAIVVTTQGNPRAVVLLNLTQECMGVHFTGMTDAHFFKIDNAATAWVSANGITLGTNQFTIGTDATINTASDVGFWGVII